MFCQNKSVLLLLLATGLLMARPSSSHGSEEEIHRPHEASLAVNAGASFSEVRVTLRASESRLPTKLTAVDLWVNGKNVEISEAVYADLAEPLLDSVQIRSEVGYDEHPWLYVYFELAYRMEDGQWRPKRVHLAYHNGKLEYRSIDTPHPDGSYTHKQDKL